MLLGQARPLDLGKVPGEEERHGCEVVLCDPEQLLPDRGVHLSVVSPVRQGETGVDRVFPIADELDIFLHEYPFPVH